MIHSWFMAQSETPSFSRFLFTQNPKRRESKLETILKLFAAHHIFHCAVLLFCVFHTNALRWFTISTLHIHIRISSVAIGMSVVHHSRRCEETQHKQLFTNKLKGYIVPVSPVGWETILLHILHISSTIQFKNAFSSLVFFVIIIASAGNVWFVKYVYCATLLINAICIGFVFRQLTKPFKAYPTEIIFRKYLIMKMGQRNLAIVSIVKSIQFSIRNWKSVEFD